jgi:hypothetical protein
MGVSFLGSDSECGSIASGVASKGPIDTLSGLDSNTVRIADNSAARRSAARNSLHDADDDQF